MLIDAEFECPYCGAAVPTKVDPSGGSHQVYTEECSVCCQPSLLRIEIDRDDPGRAIIQAEPERGSA